jgi:regulator of sirC expression with transglutaminase-like and TPR domain
MDATSRERFVEIAASPDEKIELDEAALVIAAEACPGLDIPRYRRVLDGLAEGVRPAVIEAAGCRERVEQLNEFLFRRARFRGNRTDYADPRNSLLNQVLDRRTGIPITLSVVYMEVARRLGLPVRGVNFPAHFLAKYSGDEEILIDPYFARTVSAEECLARLRRALGPGAELGPDPFAPATHRAILVRMLANLKSSYIRLRQFELALGCCERILLLVPGTPLELRDRGLVYHQLECFGASRADLEQFLELEPGHESASAVRKVLISVSRHAARIH